MGYYQREPERQASNRAEMAEDERIYDNEHWRPDEKATLEERSPG